MAFGVRDLIECLSACRDGCTGVDFNFRQATCHHHSADTECTTLNPLPDVTHFRIQDVCCKSCINYKWC